MTTGLLHWDVCWWPQTRLSMPIQFGNVTQLVVILISCQKMYGNCYQQFHNQGTIVLIIHENIFENVLYRNLPISCRHPNISIKILFFRHFTRPCRLINFLNLLWGTMLDMGSAYERRRYHLTPPLACWSHTQNNHWFYKHQENNRDWWM